MKEHLTSVQKTEVQILAGPRCFHSPINNSSIRHLFTNLDVSLMLEWIQKSGVRIAMFVLGVGENGALWHRRNEGSQLLEEREGGRGREREGEGGRE